MEQDSSQLFQEIKETVSAYTDLKLEYYKLSAYENVGKWSSQLSYVLIMVLGALLVLLFFLLSAAFFLGDLFNSLGLGFLAVTVILVICVWIMKITKDKMKHQLLNMIIAGLMANDEKKNNNGTDNSDNSSITPDPLGEVTIPEE